MENRDKELYDKAYAYFAYHAGQRTTMIQFFLVVLGACIALYGELIDTKPIICMLISVFLFIVTILFYFIDKRTKFDVKQSQAVLCAIEKAYQANESNPVAFGVFSNEENWFKYPNKKLEEYGFSVKEVKNGYKLRGMPHLSTCITFFYITCMLLSISGIIFSLIA